MNGRFLTICFFVLTVLITGSCDFLRKVAGRPDSEAVELLRMQEELRLLEEKAERDSAAALESRRAAQVEAETYFASSEAPVLMPVDKLKGLIKDGLDCSYLIVLGSFSQPENAVAFQKKVSEAGYDAVVLSYNYGTRIVGVCPTDDIVKLKETWLKVKGEKFFPDSAWIIVNR